MNLIIINNRYVYSIDELEHIISNNELAKSNWANISCNQMLTESFIEKYRDKVEWFDISVFQKLSEVFIERYSNKVDWSQIVKCQSLSYGFLEKHLYKYSLNNYSDKNKEHIIKLREKYPHKYEIDRLSKGE